MSRHSCTRRTLATGDFALIERCECGVVHLTIGSVTLRIAATMIEPLATTLADAARVLVIEQARAVAPSTELLS